MRNRNRFFAGKSSGKHRFLTCKLFLFFISHFSFLISPLSLLAFLSCSSPTPSPEWLALEAARESYAALVRGDYGQFLAARAGTDSLPPAYREQLLVAYKQFVWQSARSHDSIVWVESLRAEADTTLGVMQAFLRLHFADSTREDIMVPMVEADGRWKMK